MIFISHRGNIDGPIESLENHPIYLDSALKMGYDVELDIWYISNELWLGHDYPKYHINLDWLKFREKNIWIHCKNIDSLVYLKSKKDNFNFFWHENDTVSVTSLGYIWTYPGKQPIDNSIAVLPELYNDVLNKCVGICTNQINKYKNQYYDKNNYL